jgi:hypothetical protein
MALAATTPLLLGIPGAVRAQSAPGGGSFPGSLLIPGTETSLRIGGYAKLDLQYDFGVHQGFLGNGAGSGANAAVIPLDANVPGSTAGAGHGIHGTSQLSAAESRFNIETRTPTAYGELKTFIELDFEGPSNLTPGNTFETNSNRSAAALRLAYGTLGGFLAGQTSPLFRDPIASIETLDFGGAIGTAGVLRQPEIRYTRRLADGMSVALALDNPQTQFFNPVNTGGLNGSSTSGQSTFGAGQGDKIPDVIGAVTIEHPRGHLAFRLVGRYLYDHGQAALTPGLAPGRASAFGWGAGVSGRYYPFADSKDYVAFQANGGEGIGRYASDAGAAPGDSVVSRDGRTLKPVPLWDAFVGLQHWWAPDLRTNFEGSILLASYPRGLFAATPGAFASGGTFGVLNRRILSSHVNLIWSPDPLVDLGIEFIYLQRTTEAGQRGALERGQVSAKFRF